ncbi:S-layer homology domain-containing protein [bacterium]|nr:S-layer homology domain-containing protein [bacterium]
MYHLKRLSFTCLLLLLFVLLFHGPLHAFDESSRIKPGEFRSSLSGEVQKKVSLRYPKKNTVINKSWLLIKGTNRYLTAVFVNGKQIKVRKDGRFHYRHKVPKLGKHLVVVSFLTPDYKVHHVVRKVIRLATPPNKGVNKAITKDQLYFYNTGFVDSKKVPQYLGAYLQRDQLSVFISHLNGAKHKKMKKRVFRDVPKKYWAAPSISYVSNKDIMGEYPNGLFRPKRSVTRLEYAVSMVKAHGLPLKNEGQPLPFQDVHPQHWTYKFIRAALREKLIPKSSAFNKTYRLSQLTFIDYAKRNKSVKASMALAADFSKGFELTDKFKRSVSDVLVDYTIQKRKNDYAKRVFNLTFPEDGEIIIGSEVTLKGSIFPPQEFKVNGRTVRPTLKGRFSYKHDLRDGGNDIHLEVFNKRRDRFKVWSLESYSDLKKHWFQKGAAQMKFARILDDRMEKFRPKRIITRGEMVHDIAKLLHLRDKNNSPLVYQDVSKKDKEYRDIKAVFDAGGLRWIRSSRFESGKPVTRVQLISTLVNVGNYESISADKLAKLRLPFKDLSDSSWANGDIRLSYYHNLLTHSKSLRPKARVNKAEFYKMMMKLPKLNRRISERFR